MRSLAALCAGWVGIALAAGCLVTIDRDKIGSTPGTAGSGGSELDGAAGAGGSTLDAGEDAPPPCDDVDPTNTIVCPGESIQAAVDANTFGIEITIKAGLHRLQTVVPKAGNIFTGEPGAVMSGAALLTQFQKQGALWFADAQTQGGSQDQGDCYTGTGNEAGLFKAWPRCRYPEDLYIDDVPLRHVAALADVAPGTWFFDYDADRIYFADDPTGRKVETSINRNAFDALNKGGKDVTIRGLVIEKYASSATIHVTNLDNWLIEKNELRLSHGSAINVAGGTGLVVRLNDIHNNGGGIVLYKPAGALIEDNKIVNNANTDGWPGYTLYYQMGLSALGSTDLVVRLNQIRGNGGSGIRLTGGASSYSLRENTIEQNLYHGVQLHTSCAGVVSQNEIHDNGLAGVSIQRTQGVEIFANKFSGNGSSFFPTAHPWAVPYQINLTENVQYEPSDPCAKIANENIHDNTVVVGATVFAVDTSVTTGFLFSKNTYDLKAAPAKPFRIASVLKTEQEWAAAGYDNGSVYLR